MKEEEIELAPKKQSLFPVSAEDIVDSALQNLDEDQARAVTRKAAEEVVKIAVEKRRAEYRNNAAQDEMKNLIDNANLLDGRGGDYKINSTFETASGTTNVEIRKSKFSQTQIIAASIGLITVILLLTFLAFRG